MIGNKSGFQTLFKQYAPDVLSTHCHIHRVALASRVTSDCLVETINLTISIIIFVKNSPLNSRFLSKLCEELDEKYKTLVWFTNVLWLSKGNMLTRVFELRSTIYKFLLDNDKPDIGKKFYEDKNIQTIAYLVDIISKINNLNLRLQGPNASIIYLYDSIKSFTSKIAVYYTAVENGNY